MSTKQIIKNKEEKSYEKKGGPYTKMEQDKRRSQVYELYFDKGFSAVKISEMVKVNRNTINSDIKYLLSLSASHLGTKKMGEAALKHLERMEIQRRRILDFLDPKDIEKSLKAEKLLMEIEKRIGSFSDHLCCTTLIDKFSVPEENSDEAPT